MIGACRRALAWVLCAAIAWSPAHAGQLVLSQIPPASLPPPAPNVIVTLDDSNSMGLIVAFSSTQAYPVPPDHVGNPLEPRLMDGGDMLDTHETYLDGYKLGISNDLDLVNLWNGTKNDVPDNSLSSYRTDYRALAAEKRPAYLRWFAFYRTRLLAMRASVMMTFNAAVIPDGRIRLAWQGLIGSCRSGFGPSGCVSGSTTLNNAMWPLDNSTGARNHRANFFRWVQRAPLALSTPTRSAYVRAGEYLRETGLNSPWSHLPGTTQQPEVSCRRAYQVLFTDGEWTGGTWDNFENVPASQFSVNNANANTTLPDGVAYTQQLPYKGGGTGSLASLAFKYWAMDLQTGANFGNDLVPLKPVVADQTFGSATLTPYWNPANNPATWQHLVTYAIGFGDAGSIADPLWQGSTFAGADFAKLVDGTKTWADVNGHISTHRADLWHAAVNSRGRMFAATDQAALNAAFKSILGEIISQNTASGGAATSYLLGGTSFRIVRAGYTSVPRLRGTLEGYGLTSSGVPGTAPLWDGQAEMAKVAHGSRVVLTASSPTSGAAFRWARLSDYQKAGLNLGYGGVADTLGSARVDYLRGDSSREMSPANAPLGAAHVMRWREGGPLGTITNSEPKVVAAPRAGFPSADYRAYRRAQSSRTPVAYLGANDGMLHGFDLLTGKPVLSYVPRSAYATLGGYTDPQFIHRMYVDGPIITGDYLDGTTWKTILVGAPGAGGRGIFALDVTDPTKFSEVNAASLVKFDYTAPAVSPLPAQFQTENGNTGMAAELATDLGHIVSDPVRDAFIGRNLQIARMRNGKWALIFGNGVNSVNERAALYILFLDGSGFRKVLTGTETGQGNGLSTPLPVDVDNDGRVDLVYAGDMLGRLWKFDLSDSNDANWKVAETGSPAAARPIIDTGRPITSAPAVAEHPAGGLLVTFGTGRSLTDQDRTSGSADWIYGIWDKPGAFHDVTDSDLVTRTLSATTATVDGGNVPARVLSASATAVDYASRRGWRIKLDLARERVIYNPIVQGRLGYYSTYVPATAAGCGVTQGGSLLAFDIISGAEPALPVIDISGDGAFTVADRIKDKSVMGRATGAGRLIGLFQAQPDAQGKLACSGDMVIGSSGTICARKSAGPGRRLWREMRN